MYLNKKQLKFLKSIPENGDIKSDDMTDEQFKIAVFLEKEGLVNVKREIIHTRIDSESHIIKHTYGNIISVSQSERGKTYLSDIKIGKREKWIPIIISVLALLKSYDIPGKIITLCMKLLELLQKSQ